MPPHMPPLILTSHRPATALAVLRSGVASDVGTRAVPVAGSPQGGGGGSGGSGGGGSGSGSGGGSGGGGGGGGGCGGGGFS